MIETQETTQEDSEQQMYERAESTSSWYDLTLKILSVGILIAAAAVWFWPVIMHTH